MPNREDHPSPIVVIGASAGGLEALKQVLSVLPPDLEAPVCIVLHIAPSSESRLARILRRVTELEVEQASDGEALKSGRIYVAAPGKHMTVHDGHIVLSTGPKENGTRPAIDTLFRSAADEYCDAVVGVLLSGASGDGTRGLEALNTAGAVTIVQDPDDAIYPTMPQSALDVMHVEMVLPADRIGRAIVGSVARLSSKEVSNITTSGNGNGKEQPQPGAEPGHPRPGVVSQFTCPECDGTLWENPDPAQPQYQCRVGHAYSLDALSDAQSTALEAAMWSALRSMEETIALSERIAERSRARGNDLVANRYERRAARLTEHARVMRDVVVGTEAHETDLTR